MWEQVLAFVAQNPGLTDGEINQQLFGGHKWHAHINQACRGLESSGMVVRRRRPDGRIGNFPTDHPLPVRPEPKAPINPNIVHLLAKFMADSGATHHRYLSWDYCYEFFNRRDEIRRYEALLDTATVHLAWYLASWGMLRGSGGLLWKNHRFLVPVVETLVNHKYDRLVGSDPAVTDKEDYLEAVMGQGGLRDSVVESFLRYEPGFPVSDTMATKVLLGAMGCTPAYDRYVRAGLDSCGLRWQFDRRSLEQVFDFYLANLEAFRTPANGVPAHYPAFKRLDMYFFQLGNSL